MLRTSGKLAIFLLSCSAFGGFVIGPAVLPQPVQAATQGTAKVAQLGELRLMDQRVSDIGWRLASRNLELCPVHYAATGISLHTASQYDLKWRDAAREAFAFGSAGPTVLAVAKGSPAWEAGIRPNDMILSVNGKPLTEGDPVKVPSRGAYAETDLAMTQLESMAIGQPIALKLDRGSGQIMTSITPIAACASRFEMATSNELNANSNGSVVQVFGRLVVSFSDDDDLALVMAHELAHNILGHNQSIRRKRMSTGLAAIWTGSGKVLRDFERQADRYGIFLAARADFDYSNAAGFWKRLASAGGIGSWIAVTHPNPKNRQQVAQAAVDEVNSLNSQGKPLVPANTEFVPN